MGAVPLSDGIGATIAVRDVRLVGGVVRWRLRFGVGFGDWVVGLEYPPRRGSGELEAGLVGVQSWMEGGSVW